VKISVTREALEAIKADLRRTLPEVKSSHRAEAIARGLGCRTNAGMLAALANGRAECVPNPDAFITFLAERGHAAVDGRALVRAALRVPIRSVMAAHEELTYFGFGVYDYDHPSLSVDEWPRGYGAQREEMLNDHPVDQFERACEYLSQLEVTGTFNRRHTSYNLKHAAERFHRRRGIQGGPDRVCVSNGMLLVAAHHLGLRVRRTHRNSFTGQLNVSWDSVRNLDSPLPQPEDGQPFSVLGCDDEEMRYFFLPAGSKKVVSLRPRAFSPANLLRLAPLDYWVGLFPPRNRQAPFDTREAMVSLMIRAGDAGYFNPDKYWWFGQDQASA